jgi:hypothetical protein
MEELPALITGDAFSEIHTRSTNEEYAVRLTTFVVVSTASALDYNMHHSLHTENSSFKILALVSSILEDGYCRYFIQLCNSDCEE